MKVVIALILACLVVVPGTLLPGPASGVTRASTFAGVTVPLQSLSPDTSKGSQILSRQNPGHVNKTPLTQGFQLGDKDAYMEYAFNGRYATLSGTLYGDDNSSNTATILIVDTTQRNPTVLLRADVPRGARQTFHVSVRGVGHVMIQQIECCGVYVDIVAAVTPGPRVPPPPATGAALDAATQETARGSQPLTLDNPGHFSGVLIAHGFQLGDKDAYVGYTLNGKYTTLVGTLYGDDNSSNTATILIVDTTARDPRVLLRTDVPRGARKLFTVSVRNVDQLMIQQIKCCGVSVDVVAALAQGRRVRIPPFVGTALEAAPIDSSQGSQLLTLDNPGHFSGVLIAHGFQLSDSGAYATYLPRRHYTTLTGTLYGDDSSSNTGTIAIVDAGGARPRVLARFDVPRGARRAFTVPVRGVNRLMIQQTACCGIFVDVVAALTH